MHALLTSKRWHLRGLRILVLLGVGWWVLQSMGLVHAQLPAAWEWPQTDFDTAIVDLDEIISGGPPKDGIPAIDKPRFVGVGQANQWLDPREPVVVVSVGETAKAYPIQILMYHEIVNDTVGERPLAVTFCPLCNASIVFDRRVNDTVLDFGTTGRLRKSDLVMYDRETESWWQQFTGQAIVGELAGIELERYPANIVAYGDFRDAHPDGQILSRETGHRRPYGRNPYRGYDSIDDQPFLFSDPVDPRLPAMEYVLNISVGDRHKLYPFSVLKDEPVINDSVADQPFVVFSREGTFSALDQQSITESRTIPSATAFSARHAGRVLTFANKAGRIVDEQTGSQWNLLGGAVSGPLEGQQLTPASSGVHFAFAWLAFNPDSEIYARTGSARAPGSG